jgi:hypothetical protein
VDSNVEPGVTWDNTAGRHVHGYPPFDLRLFNQQNGCYYFIGDPTDFGYAGENYSYYGAHPILAAYGGGWCFMIGPHHHFWRPWSPMFVTVGPWFYWQGPYDPFFWTYWPYYHYYYRAHYPVYYSRGSFFRGHTVAPRIGVVPRPPHYGNAWHGGYRGGPMAPRAGMPGPGINRGAPGMAPRPGAAPGAGLPPRPGVTPGANLPPRPGVTPGANLPPRPGVTPGAGLPPRPGAAAGSVMPRTAPSGGFAPRGFSAPAPRGFSAPAAPRGFSAPAPRPSGGGAHFGGGRRR